MEEGKPSMPKSDNDNELIRWMWLKNLNPYYFIRNINPDIELVIDKAPLVRLKDCNEIVEWKFTIHLKNWILTNLSTVTLISVENRDPKFDIFFISAVDVGENKFTCESYQTNWKKDPLCHLNPKVYNVYIQCKPEVPGVYRTNIFFDFGVDGFVLKRLCVDCSEFSEELDIEELKTEKQNVISNMLTESSYEMTEYSKKENGMSAIYPFPKDVSHIVTCDSFVQNYGMKSDENFQGAMHEALYMMEIDRNVKALVADENKKGLYMTIRDGINIKTISDGETISQKGELYGEIELTRKMQCTDDEWAFLNECNYVRIKIYKPPAILKLQVIQKSSDKIYVKLIDQYITSNCCVRPDEELLVDVQTVVDRLNYCNWHLAVDAYKNHISNVYKPLKNINNLDFFSQLPEEFSKESLKKITINNIIDPLRSENQDETTLSSLCIMGSYGSGKKFLIAHVIRMLAQLRFRILLCTSSNTVADYYIRQYFHVWYNEQRNENIKPIRIYDKRYPLEAVHETVLGYCLRDSSDHFRNPEETELRAHNIIVTTLENIENILYKTQFISHLIIEEAHEFFEWNILDIQRHFNIDCHKIYVTNRCQIPRIDDAIGAPFSVMTRYPKLAEISMTVVNCMHPAIIDFVNEVTMRDPLIRYPNNATAAKLNWDTPKDLPLRPLSFCDIRSKERQETSFTMETFGYKNEGEAKILAQQVHTLILDWPEHAWGKFNETSIGIYTCFPAQVHAITNELRSYGIIDVTVENIYHVRHMRHPVVFISTVQSRNLSEYRNVKSFTSDLSIVYATVSRANYAVVVVGNLQTLIGWESATKHHWLRYILMAQRDKSIAKYNAPLNEGQQSINTDKCTPL